MSPYGCSNGDLATHLRGQRRCSAGIAGVGAFVDLNRFVGRPGVPRMWTPPGWQARR